MINLNQEWNKPKKPIPIVIFGAGSIVHDAHLPAYKQAGFKVQGIYDPDIEKTKKLSNKSTEIIDLFECLLDIEFLESKSPNQETYSETLYLLRPTWSESDERSSLLQEKKDALLNQRTFESF